MTQANTNMPKTVPFNRYTPRMSFPSAMVPKTTNRTTGHTPFPAFVKRKLDYSSTGKTVRKVSRKKLLSVSEINNQNKMFYHILPDGHAAFFSARGYPDGPTGYWQPAIHACSEALSSEQSKYSDLVSRLNITTILPQDRQRSSITPGAQNRWT